MPPRYDLNITCYCLKNRNIEAEAQTDFQSMRQGVAVIMGFKSGQISGELHTNSTR